MVLLYLDTSHSQFLILEYLMKVSIMFLFCKIHMKVNISKIHVRYKAQFQLPFPPTFRTHNEQIYAILKN